MKKLIYLFITVMLVSGCATSQRTLRSISLDMTKEEVVAKIGEPTVVRGSIRNKFNQVVEIWEYTLSTRRAGEFFGDTTATVLSLGILGPVLYEKSTNQKQNYWLYFYDGKLVQWGQAGDWKREADRIYDINFNTSQQLTQ